MKILTSPNSPWSEPSMRSAIKIQASDSFRHRWLRNCGKKPRRTQTILSHWRTTLILWLGLKASSRKTFKNVRLNSPSITLTTSANCNYRKDFFNTTMISNYSLCPSKLPPSLSPNTWRSLSRGCRKAGPLGRWMQVDYSQGGPVASLPMCLLLGRTAQA